MIGVAVAEETRLVVRLAIDLFESDHRLVELGGLLVIADKQVGMPQPARLEVAETAVFPIAWLGSS